MPKHTKKSKNAKARNTPNTKRELIFKTEEQEYAKVVKMLGNCRVECHFIDENGIEPTPRLGKIRNKIRRGRINRINVDDIVLVSIRDFSEDKVDILHKYNTEEVNRLVKLGNIKLNDSVVHDCFEFEEVGSGGGGEGGEEEKSNIDISTI
jgi:translation initiation factor 1A